MPQGSSKKLCINVTVTKVRDTERFVASTTPNSYCSASPSMFTNCTMQVTDKNDMRT